MRGDADDRDAEGVEFCAYDGDLGLERIGHLLDVGGPDNDLDHAMRLGQQTALERTAHLLLELAARLTAVRLADNGAFALPINQECMSQALGMSAVHLNRTLQRLKADGLISVRGSRMAILRPDRLRRISAYGCEETSALHESPQQAWAS